MSTVRLLACILVASAGAAGCDPDLSPDSYCHYQHEEKLAADTETAWGTVAERAVRHEGTFLLRPVWDSTADYQPRPGLMDELVVDAQLAPGRVHRLNHQLDQATSWSECPEYVFTMAFDLQVRNLDGSFWLAAPEVYVHSHDLPGSTGPTGYSLELIRTPPEWEEELVLEAGWSLVQFTSSTIFPTTYDGALSEPAQWNTSMGIDVNSENEYGVSWSSYMTAWAWDMERL